MTHGTSTFCSSCGKAIGNVAFCPSCGADTKSPAPQRGPGEMASLARSVRTVQNVQAVMVVGMVVGLAAGVLLAAYVILPGLGDGLVGFAAAILAIPGGALVGQRVALAMVR